MARVRRRLTRRSTEIDNVRVTACCVHVRADYDSRAAFESVLKEEGGWGKVAAGDYILWDADKGDWDHSAHNMDMHGGMVGAESLVVDPNFIAHGSKVQIPGLPDDFNIVYTAHDSGPDFVGEKWVNFSVGEGAAACKTAAKIGDHRMTIYVKDN